MLKRNRFTLEKTTGAGFKRTIVTNLIGVFKQLRALYNGDKLVIRLSKKGDKTRG